MKRLTTLVIAAMAMSTGMSAQNLKTMANNAPVEMIEVKGGTFDMGDHNKQNKDALPLHKVTLSTYYIGRTEVTQKLWLAVMGYNNSFFKGEYRPVESIEYDEIIQFIGKLNALTGIAFRLPTEAEWEYAARGGAMSKGYAYSGSNNLNEVGWSGDNNPAKTTHNVANKAPNELGIYDMTGNVWEWCSDYNGAYQPEAQTNPTGPAKKTWHQARGGGFSHFAYWNQVCYRDLKYPAEKSEGLGFRLAMDASKKNIKAMKTAKEWYLTKAVVKEKTEKVQSNTAQPNSALCTPHSALKEDSALTERNIVANPTKEQLVGIWQACSKPYENGGRKYGITFKILNSDGTFANMSVADRSTIKFSLGGNGTWTLNDGCLVETIDAASTNIFRGKTNAMQLTLSDNGNIMHIIWVNTFTGARMDEYYERVRQ